jgi:GNAT superfamily N-acetyltransferase
VRVEIREESPSSLIDYASVSIAFEVRERLAVAAPDLGLRGLHLATEPVPAPYVKDYDADGHAPPNWASRFDLGRWGVLAAFADGKRVGGATIARDTPAVTMLEGRLDVAVLWDLRVTPSLRGRGVGTLLLRRAEAWAASHGGRWLKIETQNVNVAACRFYAGQGCRLGAIHRFAYPTRPDEAQLLWYKAIGEGL